jgi:GDP-4-dehydro-6-deoxy-D-mannose reductase
MPSYARILMTGASGFVGRRLAPALPAAYPAAALAAIAHSPSDTCPGWTTLGVDLADADAVNEVVRSWRPNVVVHLAAQSSVGDEAELAEETWRINACGGLNLACAIARTVRESIVFNVSTGEVYGSSFLNGPASETTPLSPRGVYARSKAAAETIFEDVLPPNRTS